nr:hypothetical protein [uncultured Flavobacterium sp.]
MSNISHHISEKLIAWSGIGTGILGTLFAEGVQRNVMFCVGFIAGITTIIKNFKELKKKKNDT